MLKGFMPKPIQVPFSRITCPRGTRLEDIVWLPANHEWQIWTGLEQRHLPPFHPDREGTFLSLRPSGEVVRVHESHGIYHETLIRPERT